MIRINPLTSMVCGAVTLLAVTAASATAQGVTVNGIAYDSLHAAPLGGALISVVGTALTTTADSLGRFRIGGVAPGNYRFMMQHDVLDSLGMSGVSSLATVSD